MLRPHRSSRFMFLPLAAIALFACAPKKAAPEAAPEAPAAAESPRLEPDAAGGADVVNASTALVTVPEPEVDDDSDNPLSELAQLGEAAAGGDKQAVPEAGGSIRAKNEPDLVRSTRLSDPGNVRARVEAIVRGRFPLVALRIQVLEPARDNIGSKVKKGDRIVVIPEVRMIKGRLRRGDEASEINAGSYYLKKGDKIAVRPGTDEDGRWVAVYVERF